MLRPGPPGNTGQMARIGRVAAQARWGLAGLVAVRIGDPQTERVRQGWAAQAGPITLVGRESELERLAAAARAARAGRGQMVLISGEPGIGKTAVLAALAGRAADGGARVAAGAAE